MTYREQIRSPQWISFATELKEKNGWKCRWCGSAQGAGNELSIHHIFYLGSVPLWEYPENLLECLCADCHVTRQAHQNGILATVAAFLHRQPNDLLASAEIWPVMRDSITVAIERGALG